MCCALISVPRCEWGQEASPPQPSTAHLHIAWHHSVLCKGEPAPHNRLATRRLLQRGGAAVLHKRNTRVAALQLPGVEALCSLLAHNNVLVSVNAHSPHLIALQAGHTRWAGWPPHSAMTRPHGAPMRSWRHPKPRSRPAALQASPNLSACCCCAVCAPTASHSAWRAL